MPRIAPRFLIKTDFTGGLKSFALDGTDNSHKVVRESPVRTQRASGDGSLRYSGFRTSCCSATSVCITRRHVNSSASSRVERIRYRFLPACLSNLRSILGVGFFCLSFITVPSTSNCRTSGGCSGWRSSPVLILRYVSTVSSPCFPLR
jgi:hypothetical protein